MATGLEFECPEGSVFHKRSLENGADPSSGTDVDSNPRKRAGRGSPTGSPDRASRHWKLRAAPSGGGRNGKIWGKGVGRTARGLEGLLGRYADAIAMPTEPSPNPHLDIFRGAQLAGILKRSGEIERVRIRWHPRPSQSRDTLAKRRWCGGENADGTSAHWINSSPYPNGLQARPTPVDRRQRWQTVA